MENDVSIVLLFKSILIILILFGSVVVCACIGTNPPLTLSQNGTSNSNPDTDRDIVTSLQKPGEPVILSAEGISIQILNSAPSWSDGVLFWNLTIKNTGTIAIQKHRLASMYVLDKSGNKYHLSRDVKILGLVPGESRTGIIEVEGIPEKFRRELIFIFKFGENSAEFKIS